MKPQAVLFDCDGVIVDSEGPTFDLLIEDLALYGVNLTLHELEARFIGGTIEGVGEKLREAGYPLPLDWATHFYQKMYAMLAQNAPLIQDILSVFDALDRAGIPYAVASNGSRQKMEITLGQHGLLRRFKAVLSAQALGAPKPAPDVYLAAAKACGADPAHCVVIEDSPSGAKAALAAQIPCLGFTALGPETHAAQTLAVMGVTTFDAMKDLPALLGLSKG